MVQRPSATYIKTQCFTLPVATPAIASLCVPFAPGGVVAPGTCTNLLGNGGRNEVYGPGLIDFDFSAVKDTRVVEKVTVQFRAEMFNIFNRPNFNPPLVNSVLFGQDGSSNAFPSGTAGQLDSTSTSSRQIQFALKVIF
jgi:hypothetical protein